MTKSRREELNPIHTCSGCGVEHFFIPPMKVNTRNPAGQIIQAPLIPVEIILVADGYAPFACDNEPHHASPVPLVGMLWGVSGNPQPCSKSVIVLN